MDNTFGKDYFISVNGDRVIVCKNAEGNLRTYEELNDPKLRFLYEVGQRVLTPFGIQTIKEIDYNYGSLEKNHGYEWLILVEENGNQYKPFELIGIVVNETTFDQFVMLTKLCCDNPQYAGSKQFDSLAIERRNSVIAEYMGDFMGLYWSDINKCYLDSNGQLAIVNNKCGRFNISYDWLMPVIDKLESIKNLELSIGVLTDIEFCRRKNGLIVRADINIMVDGYVDSRKSEPIYQTKGCDIVDLCYAVSYVIEWINNKK